MSFVFKKNKLFLRMLKIADFFLRKKSEEGWSFLPFILYLEMALAYLRTALLNLTEAKGQGRENVRLGVFQKGNTFLLKYLVLKQAVFKVAQGREKVLEKGPSSPYTFVLVS